MGDKTPADLVLFNASDLKVDNSSLTGESEPQERLSLPDGSPHRAVEAENLVRLRLYSSLCSKLTDYSPCSFSILRSLSAAKDTEVCGSELTAIASLLKFFFVVVVRTGDHTLIGMSIIHVFWGGLKKRNADILQRSNCEINWFRIRKEESLGR